MCAMTPDRHQLVMQVFNRAAALPEEKQSEYLAEACGDDDELRIDVESLLDCDRQPTGAFASPILGVGFNLSQYVDPDPALTADVPERIGPYRVLGVLGFGNMGVVYRAEQEQPRRQLALKVIRPDRASPSLYRRFDSEIESLGRLHHPGIAQAYDAGTADTPQGPCPYIAMELVEGERLPDYVEEHRLDDRQRLELLAMICDAVQHAHQHGVVHRDLKPANILIEQQERRPQPRVLDFGVARLTDGDTRPATQATTAGQLVGTLAYMSPEQVSGESDAIDTQTDVYSLGVIGYELLAGRLPVDVSDASVFSAMQAIRERPPMPLAEHAKRFRGDLSKIFAKALAKNKGLRYASASAFATDVRRCLAQQPILAQPPGLFYVLWKLVRRHRLVAAAAAVSLALAAYGFIRANLATRELRKHYRQTRDVARFLVGDFAENLDHVSGTAEARRALLERLRTYTGTLLASNRDDPALISAHAEVLSRLSDIACDEDRMDEALELRQRALELRLQLTVDHADQPEYLAALSLIKVKVGDVYRVQQQRGIAEEWYRESLRIDEQLAQSYPDQPKYLSNLGWSYSRLGALATDSGRRREGLEFLEAAIETFKRLAVLDSSNADAPHGLRETEMLLATLLREEGRCEAAAKHFESALVYAREAVERSPGDRYHLLALASVQVAVAGGRMADGDIEAAAELLGEAEDVARGLYVLNPRDQDHGRLLCRTLAASCELGLKRGEATRGLTLAHEAIDVAQSMRREDKESAACLRCMAKAQGWAHQAASSLSMRKEAEKHWICMVEALRRLTHGKQCTPKELRQLAQSLLSQEYPQHSDPEASRALAERAVELTGGRVASYWEVLGIAHERLGRTDKAIECLNKALSLTADDAVELRGRINDRLAKLQESS